MRYVLLLLVMVLMGPAVLVAAQPPVLTCDGGQDDVRVAIRAALDDNDINHAETLLIRADALCGNDIFAVQDLTALRTEITRERAATLEAERLAAFSPGRVDVGGYALFMTCEGDNNGNPTVITENGLGWGVETWDDVLPAFLDMTRVCRYNRRGYYPSDGTRQRQTAVEQARALHTLLNTAAIEPPYIYVGHSIAGFMLTTYPMLYPDEVVGLVFVDASHPEQWERGFNGGNAPTAFGAEMLDIPESLAAMRAIADPADVSAIPAMVLVADRFQPGATMLTLRYRMQEAHAARYDNSQLVLVADSGHYIQNDQPQAVVDGLAWVLQQVDAMRPAGGGD